MKKYSIPEMPDPIPTPPKKHTITVEKEGFLIMEDHLNVYYNKDEKRNESGLLVSRVNKADKTFKVLKMVIDEEAEKLYELLINQEVRMNK